MVGPRVGHRHEHCRRTVLAGVRFCNIGYFGQPGPHLLRLGRAAQAASWIFSQPSFCLSTALSPPSLHLSIAYLDFVEVRPDRC